MTDVKIEFIGDRVTGTGRLYRKVIAERRCRLGQVVRIAAEHDDDINVLDTSGPQPTLVCARRRGVWVDRAGVWASL